jgi:very-short-patch-repair endonuclease
MAQSNARHLRQAEPSGEQLLWSLLKARQLGGWTFKRQMPIGPYIADFICHERGIVIEVDGRHHLERAACNRARDEYMLAAGYSVYRVPVNSVLEEREFVLDSILAVLEGRIEDFVGAPTSDFRRSVAKAM